MKNNSNIYDIDGELIRSIDDIHEWTLEEVQKKIEYYRKKYEELPEKDPKKAVYNTYLKNLSICAIKMYSELPPDTEARQKAKETLENEVKNAMDELAKDVESGEEPSVDIEMEQPVVESSPVSQKDLLVERDNVETVMDEYVQFEELPDSNKENNE